MGEGNSSSGYWKPKDRQLADWLCPEDQDAEQIMRRVREAWPEPDDDDQDEL
ncbi:hypothetical protein O7627_31770 [Solwaraspora sp. WMMD1047]|uniref:hypothetical protein n=1 Tax=Solwaraspora sp. WMMD1047 TaxID=3016102 RepID=UPI0024168E24|nr:hypothetical protein [Solwaraspora sp. WMMD1047]MDG4833855.1 hypothetical protein [Solwaraspora sp. WMMD1047]